MPHDLVRGILENNHGSISKAITLIENNQIPPDPLIGIKTFIKIKPIIGPTITLPIEVIMEDPKEKTFICVNPIPKDIKIRTIIV